MKASVIFLSFLLSASLASVASAEEGHAKGQGHRDNSALFPQPKMDASKGTAPEATTLLEPKFQSTVSSDTVSLTWKEVAGATVYHVQVATDPNFKWLKQDDHNVKGTSFQLKGLEKDKTYYWRVAAWKGDNMAAANKGPFARSVFETK